MHQKLDLHTTAEHHLKKTLHRIKSIANTGALPSHNPSISVPDTATSNVTARLYNAQLVKAALATTIQQVRQALCLDVTTTVPPGKKAKKEGSKEEHNLVVVEEEEWQGFSDDSEDRDNEDFAEYDGLLASSDGDESDLDDSRDSSAAQLKRELAQAVASFSAGDDSSDTVKFDTGLSDTSTNSAERPAKTTDVAKRVIHAHVGVNLPRATSKSDIPSHAPAHSPSPLPGLAIDRDTGLLIYGTKPTDSDSDFSDQPPSPKLKPTSSAFLPSLTMGGYWSGSEGDEPEDIEDHVAPRKNRRGQRARQAIAEAKFGVAAKHVVEGRPANKPKDVRDAGWDMKRGATNAEDVRGVQRHGQEREEKQNERSTRSWCQRRQCYSHRVRQRKHLGRGRGSTHIQQACCGETEEGRHWITASQLGGQEEGESGHWQDCSVPRHKDHI